MFTPTAVLSSGGAAVQYLSSLSRVAEYQLLDNESKNVIVNFDSFISMDFATDGEVTSSPVEQGAFAVYNKTQAPKSVKAELAIMGDTNVLSDIVTTLTEYQNGTALLDLVTPVDFFEGYNLENFNYTLKHDGIGLLIVTIQIVEVREVEAEYTDTKATKPISKNSAKKAGNASTQEQGKKQPNRSAAKHLWDSAKSILA